MSVGEFKAQFSQVLEWVRQGKTVGVTYGKKAKKVAELVPVKSAKKGGLRKLGLLEGKATVKFAKDFKMTDEEFLNS